MFVLFLISIVKLDPFRFLVVEIANVKSVRCVHLPAGRNKRWEVLEDNKTELNFRNHNNLVFSDKKRVSRSASASVPKLDLKLPFVCKLDPSQRL